jgi:hypothetical protein
VWWWQSQHVYAFLQTLWKSLLLTRDTTTVKGYSITEAIQNLLSVTGLYRSKKNKGIMNRFEDICRLPADCAGATTTLQSASSRRTNRQYRSMSKGTPTLSCWFLILALISQSASAFLLLVTVPAPPHATLSVRSRSSRTRIFLGAANANGAEDDISRQLERARALIAKSKAKIERKNELTLLDSVISPDGGGGGTGAAAATATGKNLPFFASKTTAPTTTTTTSTASANNNNSNKMDQVIKSRNQETGLLVADGEKMAQRSEGEEWVRRPLLEVFEQEGEESATATSGLANRDVAASIYNLRRLLQTEDYRRIFDSKNRFIGEDN